MFPKLNQNYFDMTDREEKGEGKEISSNRIGSILQTISLTTPFRYYLNCTPFKQRRTLLHTTDLDNRHNSSRGTLAELHRFYTNIIRRESLSDLAAINKNQFSAYTYMEINETRICR